MTYRGCWIVCRNCFFPIRLPSFLKTPLCFENTRSIPILLACPVCARVEQHRRTDFEAIPFQIPDPFRLEKAALYVVEIHCGVQHCDGTARIYAVAATTLSVTSLLELWKHWKIQAPCRSHSFKACKSWTWGVYGVYPVHRQIFEQP